MDAEPKIEDTEIHPLGEIRMGCEAFGVTIKTNYGEFDFLSLIPVAVGKENVRDRLEISSCGRYLKVEGEFATWVLDIRNQSISIYRATIRTENNEWSEEQVIYGNERTHISGFKRHIHLQVPFVEKASFEKIYRNYESLRQNQIIEAASAL